MCSSHSPITARPVQKSFLCSWTCCTHIFFCNSVTTNKGLWFIKGMLLFPPDTCNSTTTVGQAVRHGSKVAFQSRLKIYWLGCSTTTTSCANSECPGMYIKGNEWNSCSQNVFQIFRAKGHGDVRVGDLVGLYLTRESGKWLTCHETTCRKEHVCPGIASYEYGFDTPEKWYRCYGAVFKIYAHEKQLGDTVNDQDDIMLFYLQALNWIRATNSNHHDNCPGTTRPPPHNKYDACSGEVYKIWKR